MPVTVIAGGQFGSEGKGKVAHFFARESNAIAVVRVGGSNSGHTVYDEDGVRHAFRHLPTAAILPDLTCVLGAGSYIDPDVLRKEIDRVKLSHERLLIDPNAFVITQEHKDREEQLKFGERIGSTLSGTGESFVDRARRLSDANLAKNHPYLSQFTGAGPVRTFLRDQIARGERILIEGTQGFGLSSLHSPYYPKVTSRDTTAAAFVSEAGLSPRDVDQVILVIRAFPIRVSGDSGELPYETTWSEVAKEGNWPEPFEERTTVTGNIRRVGRFDPEIVKSAIDINLPTQIVLNHVDYFDSQFCTEEKSLGACEVYVEKIERLIGQSIDWIGRSGASLTKRKVASAADSYVNLSKAV